MTELVDTTAEWALREAGELCAAHDAAVEAREAERLDGLPSTVPADLDVDLERERDREQARRRDFDRSEREQRRRG